MILNTLYSYMFLKFACFPYLLWRLFLLGLVARFYLEIFIGRGHITSTPVRWNPAGIRKSKTKKKDNINIYIYMMPPRITPKPFWLKIVLITQLGWLKKICNDGTWCFFINLFFNFNLFSWFFSKKYIMFSFMCISKRLSFFWYFFQVHLFHEIVDRRSAPRATCACCLFFESHFFSKQNLIFSLTNKAFLWIIFSKESFWIFFFGRRPQLLETTGACTVCGETTLVQRVVTVVKPQQTSIPFDRRHGRPRQSCGRLRNFARRHTSMEDATLWTAARSSRLDLLESSC